MRRQSESGGAVVYAARWAGRVACVVGVIGWSAWLAWRVLASQPTVLGVGVLVLEVAAMLVSVALTAALWSVPSRSDALRGGPGGRSAVLPDVLADLLGLDELVTVGAHGADDTGEVARARRGLGLLDPRRSTATGTRRQLGVIAWALVAVEGIRRMLFVALLVAVLLSGRLPFTMPGWSILAVLVAAQCCFAVGHWLLSGGALRPGVRLRWSMASVGAGLGDGTSRTGLPIRWTSTLATMVVLNLAVALRGVSDRWTHGLTPMPHDERVAAMVLAWWLVAVGFASLRVLAKPSLGFYGATRRLEETSTRRLALGTTLAVAVVGFVAGVLPSGLPA
jgi:hypothetical protein